MTVEQEEKLIKSLGIFTLLVFLPLNVYILKNDVIRLMIIVLLLIAFAILHYRKYNRDKKAGNDLTRYKILLFFIGISFLLFITFLSYPML